MRITFMIGNGFDKKVGLKTGYSDFYKSLDQNTKNSIIKSIKEDTVLWSDMEEGLGNYYTDVISERQSEFIEQKHEIEILLEEYLSKEQNRADYSKKDDISAQMIKSIANFQGSLTRKDAEAIKNLKTKIEEHFEYSFIVFNYTHVFDNCIKLIGKGFDGVAHKAGGRLHHDHLGKIHHVNGIINDGIILGIDNENQTQCSSFGKDEVVSNYLVKRRINESYGELRTEDAGKMIDESIIICIFGMSLGATDKMWWKKLINWLAQNELRRLVIFSYDEGYRKDAYSVIMSEHELLNRFKAISEANNITWDKIKSKIHIGVNPDLFNIKLCNN